MRLRVLHDGPWKVVAPLDARGRCNVLLDFEELTQNPKTKSTAAGFKAWWTHITKEGPRASLPDAVYHSVNSEERIYEFIKGNYRLLCFEADGALIICSHLMRKKSQKTPKADIARAVQLKDAYLSAKGSNAVELVQD